MSKRTNSTKRASAKTKAVGQPEKPNDGDLIQIVTEDSVRSWGGYYIFREVFEDVPNKRTMSDVVILSAYTFMQQGEFAHRFERVKFWRKWKGTFEDTPEWFNSPGKSGMFSKPNTGPAFVEPERVPGARPNDGEAIEVNLSPARYDRNNLYLYKQGALMQDSGTYWKSADCFCNSDGVPYLPYAEWIRFRPTSATKWQPGPRFEEWQAKENKRLAEEERKLNKWHFDTFIVELDSLMQGPQSDSLKRAQVEQWLAGIKFTPYATAFGSEGGGEDFRVTQKALLENALNILDRALSIVPKANEDRQESEAERFPLEEVATTPGPYNITVKALAVQIKQSHSNVCDMVREAEQKKKVFIVLSRVRVPFERRGRKQIFFQDKAFGQLKLQAGSP